MFNAAHVDSALEQSVSRKTPTGSPRVSQDPVRCIFAVHSPSDERRDVIGSSRLAEGGTVNSAAEEKKKAVEHSNLSIIIP